VLGGDHPVLQLDQLGLQAKQLAEVLAAVFLVLVCQHRAIGGGGQLVDGAVLQLQLELFVVAVDQVFVDALDQVFGLGGHGGARCGKSRLVRRAKLTCNIRAAHGEVMTSKVRKTHEPFGSFCAQHRHATM
jgi:hypothetical protein